MKIKDFVIIGILITIVVLIIKMMKTSKDQNAVLMAVAVKTGAIDAKALVKSKTSSKQEEYEEEEEDGGEEDNSKATKKIRLKKHQKQIVSLFSDGIPRQIGELRDMYMAKFSDMDKTKFYNTLYNLKPSNTLNFEKIDDINYWGLGEWFDEDGSLFEEYAEKISAVASTTPKIITNE